MEQTRRKKGIHSTEFRRKNIHDLFRILKNLRKKGNLEVSFSQIYSSFAIETGISRQKFQEYLQIWADSGMVDIDIEQDVVILNKALEEDGDQNS